MKTFFLLSIFFLLGGCISTDIVEFEDKLYFNSQEGTHPKAVAFIDENLEERGIVVMRAKFDDDRASKDPSLNLVFSTQNIQTAYSGKTLMGNNDFSTADRFIYKSKINKFVALALVPGEYRYISTFFTGGITSRFSPTRDISFTVKAGKAIYVGDMVQSFHENDLKEYQTLLYGKGHRLKSSVIDFKFSIIDDYSAAKQYYDAIQNKPNWPFEFSKMTNSNNPYTHYYADPKCNGFYHSYSSSRGFCR